MFYRNVLHIMSHNFSQLSPMRYISNYFSSQSMGVRRYFCQWRPRLKHSPHKEKKRPYHPPPPPPPPNRENDSQNKKQCLLLKEKPIHMENKAPIRGGKSLKKAHQIENFLFSWGGGQLPILLLLSFRKLFIM